MTALTLTMEDALVKTGGGVYGDRRRQKTFKREPLQYVEFRGILGVNTMLNRLSRLTGPVATTLYSRIVRAWTRRRVQRVRLTLSPAERSLIEELGTDYLTETNALHLGVVSCPLWIVKYRNTEYGKEVVVRTQTKPTRERRFRVPGHGKPKFQAVAAKRLPTTEEDHAEMATRTKKRSSSSKSKKAKEEPEVDDELDGIEEDLDDLDELEEPDAVADDDDEDEEDEKPKRKRSRSKTSTAKKSRSRKAKDEDEEDEEEDDDEDEEPKAKKRQKKGAAKGGKKSSGSKKGQAPPTRELPKGKLGASDVAELAGTDGRTVRQFLRRNADDFPKDEDLGRYAFTKKEATTIAKRIKKEQDED
jgi:hypothetical protein